MNDLYERMVGEVLEPSFAATLEITKAVKAGNWDGAIKAAESLQRHASALLEAAKEMKRRYPKEP